ncbi:hypothetical protein KIPB_008784, partial [Kipferlia bialata]
AVGRLILLFSDKLHVLDTVSGDCAALAEWPRDEKGRSYRFNLKLGTRILRMNFNPYWETHPVCALYTLNPALLYPSEERGWGRVLEWDKDRRGRLGLPGVE